jgi:plastocyanin
VNEERLTLSLRHHLIVASIVLLAACSENRTVEVADKTADPAVSIGAAPPATTHGVVVGKAPTVPDSKSFVVLTPADAKTLPPPAAKPLMDQVQLTFIPALLIVRAGYPVVFRSSDEELHNVNITHARTRQQEFNVAIPPQGTYEHTFKNPGFYDVHCDIHPAMAAQIFVAETPHVAVADADGSFIFEGIEPGAYTLSIYSGGNRHDRTIQVTPGRNEVPS